MLVFCGTPFGRELRWGLCTEMVPTKEATATGFRVSEGKCEIFVSRHFQKVGCKWNHVWECQLRCIPVEKRILIVGCWASTHQPWKILLYRSERLGIGVTFFSEHAWKKPKWIHCQSLPTLLVANILPPVWHFWADDSPNFPKVGYVSSLEGKQFGFGRKPIPFGCHGWHSVTFRYFSPTLRGETGADVRHMVVHLGKLAERGFLLGIFM